MPSSLLSNLIRVLTGAVATALAIIKPEIAALLGAWLVLEIRVKSVVFQIQIRREAKREERESRPIGPPIERAISERKPSEPSLPTPSEDGSTSTKPPSADPESGKSE